MDAYFSNSTRTHAEELPPVVIENPPHYPMSTNDSDDTDRLEQYIRDEKGHLDSCESMIALANWLYTNEYFDTNDCVVPTSDLKEILGDRLGYGVDTLLDHLEGINVVDEVSQGAGRFILHERTGRAFFDPNNREMLPLLEEEISRFLEDLHEQESQALESEDAGDDETQSVADGGEPEDVDSDETDETETGGEENPEDVPTTLRAVAAAALDIKEPVEDALTNPTDHTERIVRFDDVVTEVIESDVVNRGGTYEPMGWRNAANKWVLTTTAKARKENESLS